MDNELIEIRATISGQVQGVGFRVISRKLAINLGIVGTVRNLVDGRVELHAKGKRTVVLELLKTLEGPEGPGKVTAIFSEEITSPHHYEDFRII
jgi:acylphosphatase